MASRLYLARKAIAKLPSPTNKKGLTVTAVANPGATTLVVDTSAGYVQNDVLGTFNYVNPVPVGGEYVSATVELRITAINSPTLITISPALPAGCTIAAGTKFGFEGTQSEWEARVLPQLIKTLTQMADAANADANALCTRQVRAVTAAATLDLTDDIVTLGTRAGTISVQAPAGANVGWTCDFIEIAGSASQVNLTAPGGETIQGTATLTAAFGKRTITKISSTVWAAYA